jgi:hypothetical protein
MKRDNSYLINNKFAVGAGPNATSFKRGDEPWNKGRAFSPAGSEATRFKKGQPGRNWKPVGSETIRRDKNGTMRAFIKVSEPNIWKFRAVIVWENRYGPIPRGLILHHRDENALNDSIDNLCVLTRAAHINEHRKTLAAAKRRSK